MRLHFRPEFLIHRSFHHALVSLSVWRNNRAAADAFRDPAMLNKVNVRWKGSMRKSRRLRLLILGAVLAVAYAAFQRRHTAPDQAKALLETMLSVPAVPPAGSTASSSPTPTPTPAPAPEPAGPLRAVSAPPAPAASAPAVSQPAGYPGNGYVLLACKRDRTLYVYRRDGKTWNRTAAFPMAIGRNAGDKGEAGDLRTPEGRFWITGMLAGRSKGPMYGPLVFTLNYPRPGDVAEGKTGLGIWIHGVDAGKLPSFTHGCLSLANEDMLALSAYADIATPVVILPDSLAPEPGSQVDLAGMEREYPSIAPAYGRKTRADTAARDAVMKQARDFVAKEAKDFPELAMQVLSDEDRKAILARLDRWRSDWSARSIEAYAANYDPAFRDRQGRDKQAFIERKRRIFEAKSRIDMEIHEPRIESESYSRVKVSFRQDYLAEGPEGSQRSSDTKTLRLDEGPQGWLIITE